MNGLRILRWSLLLLASSRIGALVACPLSAMEVPRADGFEDCARNRSSFQRLAADRLIAGTTTEVVLSRTLQLDTTTRVLVIADGRHFPVDAPAATLRIRIDGDESASSIAVTDWGSSQRPVMHGFNVLADAALGAGTHSIELVASAHPSRPGRFQVGAGSGLAILVQPLSRLITSALPGASANVNVSTYAPAQGIDIREGDLNRPLQALLGHTVSNLSGRPVDAITLASGRAFHACNSGIDNGFGDALLALSADGQCPGTYTSSWSVNDLHPDAEQQAGMMLHGIQHLGIGQTRALTLVGSELAFGSDQAGSPSGAHENGVCWGLGSARLLTASGGGVSGSAVSGVNQVCATYTWRCVATTLGEAGCPAAGSDVALASAQFVIPPGHDGIVLFNARTRIQADNSDGFTTAVLGIKIDGVPVGAIGMQQLAVGAAQASRTLSASYLSAPDTPGATLTVGPHTVEAYINVSGSLLHHPSAPRDLALTWFD